MNILVILILLLIFIPIANAQSEDKLILQEKVVFGYTIASIGDLNRDGINDIAVGSPYDHDGGYNTGAVYILFLNSDGTVKSHQKISSAQGNFSPKLEPGDMLGHALTPIGDLNGDGINDIAVGSPYSDSQNKVLPDTGSIHILFLNSDGTVKSNTTFPNFESNTSEFNFIAILILICAVAIGIFLLIKRRDRLTAK